jgi:hypothetical protein
MIWNAVVDYFGNRSDAYRKNHRYCDIPDMTRQHELQILKILLFLPKVNPATFECQICNEMQSAKQWARIVSCGETCGYWCIKCTVGKENEEKRHQQEGLDQTNQGGHFGCRLQSTT